MSSRKKSTYFASHRPRALLLGTLGVGVATALGSPALLLLALGALGSAFLAAFHAPRGAFLALPLLLLLGLPAAYGSSSLALSVSGSPSRGSGAMGGDISHRNSTVEVYKEAADASARVLPIAKSQGIKAALAELERIEAQSGLIPQFSHLVAHDIGMVAYQSGLYRDHKQAMYENCDTRYQFGCVHGVIEAYFETGPSFAPDRINEICGATKDLKGLEIVLPAQCLHGLGHAIMDRNQHDLFKSLPLCLTLDSDIARIWCETAIFMANTMQLLDQLQVQGGVLTPDAHSFHPSYWSTQDLNYPCNAVETRFRPSCYVMQTTGLTYLLHGNLDRVASACLDAGDMRSRCMHSYGREMAAFVQYDASRANTQCLKVPMPDQGACYTGAAQNLTTSRLRIEDAMPLCLLASEAYKTDCYRSIGTNMYDFFPTAQARKERCALAESVKYQEACFDAAMRGEPR